jgi:CheY-like chemotaxis protein
MAPENVSEASDSEALALIDQAGHLRQIEELASGVAHDFNNLIMVIQANSELLRLKNRDASLVPLIDNILHGCQSGSTLSRSLLGYAKKQVLVRTTFPVRKLLANVVPLCEAAHGPKYPIEISVEGKPHVHACFYSLSHCLLNLLNNAVQAMPDGGKTLLQVYSEGEFVRLDVRDWGLGIDPKDMERIFEPFFTTKSSGTGMGLAMVKSVVEQHEGQIGVYSTVGEGTVISLLLPAVAEERVKMSPLVQVKTGPLARAGKPGSMISKAAASKVAFVLDDEEQITEALSQFLTALGFTVKVFNEPEAAFQGLQNSPRPGLIITDYSLPQMNGIDFIRKAIAGQAAEWQDVKLILISGFPPTEFSEQASQLPVPVHLLQKPFSFDTLKRLLLAPSQNNPNQRSITSRIQPHPLPINREYAKLH